LKNFKEGKQDIEKFLVNRAFLRSNNLASRLGIESAETGGIKKDIDTAKGMAAQEETTAKEDKPQYKTLLERKVLDSEVVNSIKEKVKSTVRVMKTRMDESVSKNVTVKPYIAELRKAMGKQADIDLKKAMGGKKDGELRKFLLRNKAAILQNMTTTYLMTAYALTLSRKKLTVYGQVIGKVRKLIENPFQRIAPGAHQVQSLLEDYLTHQLDYLMLITCLTF
jgi:hypothetical protein